VFAFSTEAQQSIVIDPKSPGSINSPHGLILFDGVCVLCSRGCGFVSKHDRRAYFRIVPMQLAEARDLVQSIGSEHTSAAVSNTAQIPGGQRRKAKNNRNAIPKRSVFSSS
jgi:predicted DCC family thiol-disulfide oxidoreductase YuxK